MTIKTEGWVILTPENNIYETKSIPSTNEIFRTKEDAEENARLMEWTSWEDLEELGYRAVRATLSCEEED